MKNRPLVSIALATYNGEAYLAQQLDSLVGQDYPNLEIVISDDCSTDNTWNILQNYANNDLRIRLLPQICNLGYVDNFIRAFRSCHGALIAPSDQDDVWHKQKISKLVDAMDDASLVYCCSNMVDENNRDLGKKNSDGITMITGSEPLNFLFSQTVCGHAMLFRSSLLDATDKLNSAPYIDWMIAFLAARDGKIKYLDEALVNWRQHKKSTSAESKGTGQASNRRRLIEIELRLNAFASIPGRQQPISIEARDKFLKWKNSYFDLSMFFFVIRHRRSTHVSLIKWHPAIKYLVGHKLKQLLRPNYY